MAIDKSDKSINSCFVNTFDIYGKQMKMHILGKESYKTSLGAIISILSIFTITAISIIFVIDFLKLNNFTIIFNKERKLGRINLNDTPILFSLGNVHGVPVVANNTFNYHVTILNYVKVGDQLNFYPIKIEFDKCNSEKHFKNYPSYEKINNLDSFFCINPGQNLNIINTFGDTINGFSILQLSLSLCDKKKQKCDSDDSIEKKISNSFLNLIFFDYEVDHYNLNNPAKLNLISQVFSFDYNLKKTYPIFLQKIFYNTDDGLIFNRHKIDEFFTFESYQSEIFSRKQQVLTDSDIFGVISFRYSNTVGFYSRRFAKLQELLANIGGVTKSIITVSSLLVKFVTRKLCYIELGNKINIDRDPQLLVNENSNESGLKIFNHQNPIKIANEIKPIKKIEKNITNDKFIRLNIFEVLCFNKFLKNNINVNKIELIEEYIKEKISIDFIIDRINNFESFMKEYAVLNVDNSSLPKKVEIDLRNNKDSLLLGLNNFYSSKILNDFKNISKDLP